MKTFFLETHRVDDLERTVAAQAIALRTMSKEMALLIEHMHSLRAVLDDAGAKRAAV